MHDPQTLQDRDCIGNNTTNPIISFKYSDHHQDDLQFRPNPCQNSMESDHSGANSPPLWKNASPSPSKSPTLPLLSHHYYNSHRSLSPDSRTQAIVRGQRELMEMVRNMPESSYELSLKDLVEHHNRLENQEPPQGISRLSNVDSQNHHLHRRGGNVKRQESKRYEVRKGGLENKGLFLNVVSPFFSLKSKKKKKIVGGGVSGGVSPKPEVTKSLGGGEKDWWTKKLSGSADSDSSRASNNFGSSIGSSSGGSSSSTRSYSNFRKRNGCVAGCWPFLRSRKSRSAE